MTLTQSDIYKIENIVEDKLDEKLEEKFNEKFRLLPSKELFLKWMDKLMGELKGIREEQTVESGHSSGHEDRISALEKIHPQYQHL